MENLSSYGYKLIGGMPKNYIGGFRWSEIQGWEELVRANRLAHPMPLLANLSKFLEEQWMKKRFMTYDEYTQHEGGKLLKLYGDGEQGYFAYMQKVNPQLWEFFFRERGVGIPRSERKMHVYSFGASGCGKTELIKNQFLDDMKTGGSTVIFIDPNGDAALQIAKFKENVGNDKLIYIDPFLDRTMTPVINPFDLPNKELYFEPHWYKLIVKKRASQIMQALLQIFADADAKFSEKMKTYLFPAICIVTLKKDGDMRDLLRIFSGSDFSDLIAIGKKSPNEEHRQSFEQGFTVPTQTKDAIRDKLKNMLNSGNLSDLICGKSTINLEEAVAG